MQPDYIPKITDILKSVYTPVSSETNQKETIRTIDELYLDVISVLPEKWVYPEDVLEVVNNLNYKIISKNTDDDQVQVGYQLFTK